MLPLLSHWLSKLGFILVSEGDPQEVLAENGLCKQRMAMNASSPLDIESARTGLLKHYGLGVVLSVVLGMFIALLSLAALGAPGYSGLGAIYLAIAGGVPLLIILVMTWICYMIRDRGRLPGRVHALMFLPALIGLGIIPMAMAIEHASHNHFSAEHPSIHELHVNLSGKDLWLAMGATAETESGSSPSMPLEAAGSVSFTRYPGRDEVKAGRFPYEGARLRQGVDTYVYAPNDEGAGAPKPTSTLPLVRLAYPDLGPLLPYETESSLLLYQYFHYPNHVEMAPSLAGFAGSTGDYLEDKVRGLVLFDVAIHKHPQPVLFRLEINGQTLALGSPIKPDEHCAWAYMGSAGALVDADKPLRLRWQTLDDPQRWHEATVNTPAFRHAIPAGAHVSWPQVLMYFIGNDKVAAERFEEVRLPGGKLALHATGMPGEVPSDTVCGSASARYNLDTVTLLPD